MKFSLRLVTVVLISEMLLSCAYVEFSRKYESSASNDAIGAENIETVLERFFQSKNLKIIKKYQEIYPVPSRKLIFEIPRASEEKRRNPNLRVTIVSNGVIVLEHQEWFLSVNPIPSMEPYLPIDYIAPLQQEIEEELLKELNIKTKISFVSKGYY